MANNKIKACCILLALVLFVLGAAMSAGTSFARYESGAICRTVIEQRKSGVVSDYLSQKPLAVLMGEISMDPQNPTKVTFGVSSVSADKKRISWGTNSLLNITVTDSDGKDIQNGSVILLSPESASVLTFTFQPTETAINQERTEKEIYIKVTVGDASGTFRMILPEVTEESEYGGEVNTSGSITEESSGENTESTGPEENSEGSGQTDENTDSSEEPASAEIKVDQAFLANAEKSEENSYKSSVSWAGPEAKIETFSKFSPDHLLPVKLTVTDFATSVKLGVDIGGTLSPFPEGTRFSLDNGESYYMTFGGYIPEFSTSQMNGTLLIDFSLADLNDAESISPAMELISEGTSEGFFSADVTVDYSSICKTSVSNGEIQMQITEETGITLKENIKSCVLEKGEALEITFPEEWASEDFSFEYSVYIMSLSEDEYMVLNKSLIIPENGVNSGLSAAHIKSAESGGHKLLLQGTEILPQAGTYVAELKWEYKGIVFYETEITFFINYSAQTVYPSAS